MKPTLAADVSNSFLLFSFSTPLSHHIEARRLAMFLIFLADTGSRVHPQRESEMTCLEIVLYFSAFLQLSSSQIHP